MLNDDNACGVIERTRTHTGSRDQKLAEQIFLAGFEEIEEDIHRKTLLQGKTLHLLANNYRDRGQFEESRELYTKAGENLKDASPDEIRVLFEDMYLQALCEEDYEAALKSQLDIYQLLSRCRYQAIEIRLQNLLRLACVYWKLTHYSEAEEYIKEYLRLAGDSRHLNKGAWIVLLYSQGFLCFRMNKLKEAETLYKMALYLDEETRTLGNEQKAEILGQLGVILCRLGKRGEARAGCCIESAQIREACENLAATPSQFRSIAESYCISGRYEEAASFCSTANDIFEKGLGVNDNDNFITGLFQRHKLLDDAANLGRRGRYRVAS